MNTFILLVLSFLSLGETPSESDISPEDFSAQEESTMTTYYFIRHAEKDESNPQNEDPELTEVGHQRALKWAEMLKDVDFDAIYSTDYNRTKQTATVIADSQDKEVQIYNPRQLNNDQFQKETKGKTVLVVGHSNTTPAFVNAVLEENKYEALDEKNYGSLFIVNIALDNTKTSQVLNVN